MEVHKTEDIRNVALAGHSGAGKTALAEAILWSRKIMDRLGKVEDGTTISDYDGEEISRRHSIYVSLLPVELGATKINLLDLPGRPDFVGDAKRCMRVSDSVVFLIDANSGVEVGTEFARDWAREFGIHARAVFVNKMDKDQANFDEAVRQVNDFLKGRAIVLSMPIGSGDDFKGVVDLVRMKSVTEKDRKVTYGDIPADLADAAADARQKLVEAAAEADEELMMKFLEDEPLTEDEVMTGLREGILEGSIMPVLAGSATQAVGIAPLLDLLDGLMPNPLEGAGLAIDASEEDEHFGVTPEGNLLAFVFKTVSDPYAGHLNFFKIMRGKIDGDLHLHNLTSGKSERIAHAQTVQGKTHENISTLHAGDIGAAAKLSSTHTGNTLAEDADEKTIFSLTHLPQPTVRMAVIAKDKSEEDKIGIGFRRLIDQDPTLHLSRDPEIHETILSGMGDGHLDIAIKHLKHMSKVEVELKIPSVPYLESITKTAQGQGKFKKQSGGRGQYGDCWIKLEPVSNGEEFIFDWAIVGGVIPTKFQPSVEKGLIEALDRGVLSGHRTIGVKATCYDGSHHAVDSSEMAFKVAASMAFKSIAPQAGPVILEPIYKITVTVPEAFLGDIMGDMNSRRGRILGVEVVGNKQVIKASVPLAEVFTYSRDLRSMTRGAGIFEMELDKYERIPADIQKKVIAESAREHAEEH